MAGKWPRAALEHRERRRGRAEDEPHRPATPPNFGASTLRRAEQLRDGQLGRDDLMPVNVSGAASQI
jgi:hypothetical protein